MCTEFRNFSCLNKWAFFPCHDHIKSVTIIEMLNIKNWVTYTYINRHYMWIDLNVTVSVTTNKKTLFAILMFVELSSAFINHYSKIFSIYIRFLCSWI